jgi:hypothetical protein
VGTVTRAAHAGDSKRSSTTSRAASAAVQAKLTLGRRGDGYEREADHVASVVVEGSRGAGPAAAPAVSSSASTVAPRISRLAAAGAQRAEEEPQAKLQRAEEEPQAKLQRAEEEPQAKLQRAEEEPQAKLQRAEEEPQAKLQRADEEPQAKLQRAEEEPQAKLQRAEEEPQAKLQRAEEEPQAKLQRAEEEPQAKLQRAEEEPQAKLQRAEEEPQAKLQRAEEEPQAKLQRAEEEPQAKLQRAEEEPQAKLQRAEEEPQAKLQRAEEESQAKLQRRSEPRANVRDKRQFPVLERVEPKLFESKGKGEALDPETRIGMETAFRADFGKVRIHRGGAAEEMNRDLRAQAFTHGRDIFFNSGKFEPASVHGKELLAHELTHVVQQGAAEQKLSDAAVQKNNATSKQVPPEPVDREARVVEAQARAQTKDGEPRLGDPSATAPMGPASPAAAASTPGPTVTSGAPVESAGSRPALPWVGVQGEAAEPSPAEAPAGKAKAKANAKPKPQAPARGRSGAEGGRASAVKGGGVGAFLRRTTQAVFASKKRKLTQLGANERATEPAEKKLADTEKAVLPPAEEGTSRAKASQIETVDQVAAPQPDEAQAKAEFNTAMERAVPRSLEEVDEFKERGKGRLVGQAVKGVVGQDTEEVKGTYQAIENAPEAAPPAPEEPLPELESAEPTSAIGMGDGVVGQVQPEHTDLSQYEKNSDQQLEDEQISQENLDMVDEGELAEANQERKALKTKVKEGPKEVKQLEVEQKQQVNKDLGKEEQSGKQTMREARNKQLKGSREDQNKTKSAIELKRQRVTDHINALYRKANDTVKSKLEALENQSLKAFDDSEKRATQAFEDNVKQRIDAFKRRRYDRFGGSLLWAKDKLFGMDELPEVKSIFDTEKATFISSIDASIKAITAENKRVVQECKQLIADARKEIEDYVQKLGPELAKTGKEALSAVKGKLDALGKQVADKEQELQKKLEAKREAAIKAIEEKIEKMKEEMSGLLAKLGNLILNAMIKLFKWALKKAGFASDQLMAILDKGKAVIKKVVTDPIGFIKNIIKAVKDGVGLFVTNIKQHLIAGMVAWLTGAMADVPITLPEKWDLKGILSLVLQIMGLTWERIRAKLVKRLGEKVVRAAEGTITIVKVLIAQGPMGLWEMLKEKATEIQQQVMDGIRNWVITELVKQAVIKLLSFFNPAGAIVQAILAIYNTIMFFVENMDRIIQFVKTVFSSIADIAMGKLSAAAQAVERSLAMAIPIILNFLSRLIGLSGIGKAVTGIIAKVRKPIDKVVDKVVDQVAKVAMKVGGKVSKAAGAAKDKAKAVALKLAAFVFPKKTFTAGNESHKLYFDGELPNARAIVASSPKSLLALCEVLEKRPENSGKKAKIADVKAREGKLSKLQQEVWAVRSRIKKDGDKASKEDHDEEKALSKKIKTAIDEIAQLLAVLMVSEAFGTESDPILLDWPKPYSKQYKPLWFGPKSKNRIPQDLLKTRSKDKIEELVEPENERDRWVKADRPIVKYEPESPANLPFGGPKIGIRSPYIVEPGKVLQLPRTKPGGTPGGDTLNSELHPYGFRPGEEGVDGDHVVEMQVGGQDRLQNLWPLDASTNRAAGGQLARSIFPIKDANIPMSVLKARAQAPKVSKPCWFKIK